MLSTLFRRRRSDNNEEVMGTDPSFIPKYMQRPANYEETSLLEMAKKYKYESNAWHKPRVESIVRIIPELNGNIPHIGEKWDEAKGNFNTWADRYIKLGLTEVPTLPNPIDDDIEDDPNMDTYIEQNQREEWMMTTTMGTLFMPGEEIEVGLRDFDTSYNWDKALERWKVYPNDYLWWSGYRKINSDAIVRSIVMHFETSKSVPIMAPTEVVAFNIGGSTTHHELGIFIERRSSYKQMTDVDLRYRNIFSVHELFNGVFVVLVGDMRQLPPVFYSPLYSKNGNYMQQCGGVTYAGFEKCIKLSHIFCQADDEQAPFKEALGRSFAVNVSSSKFVQRSTTTQRRYLLNKITICTIPGHCCRIQEDYIKKKGLFDHHNLMDNAIVAAAGSSSNSENTNTSIIASSSSPPTPSRYENQKRRDWNTFGQYLKNHRPPLSLSRCSSAHVLEFLRYLDQFGKTKIHTQICPFFGHPNPPAPCPCPLRQAWGSLDALIGRLRAAFEEHGGKPEANPFGARAVRLFLREVRELQAKARGISYEKKKRKRPELQTTVPLQLPSNANTS
ncbi:hypothetical protein GIB67_026845 [Kingdonia uniflora]|uniref:ALOG domain-containing protein n=1 Tax=Kingdonia uniflora TaxID=39325 RepID=A0A7J7M818_9MAGN|nr:hypothetical protein GIB67_026845 [Kingdonia uniflora]